MSLQVVKQWNSGNAMVFSGKDGDLTGPDREHAKGRCCLCACRSRRSCTLNLLLQAVLEVPEFPSIGVHEQRALTPARSSGPTSTPYGRFQLDMTTRLDLTQPPRSSIL